MYGGNEKCLSQCKHGFLSSSCSDMYLVNQLLQFSHNGSSGDGFSSIKRLLQVSIHQLEFLRNRMRFNWSQISRMLLVSRTTLWRRIRNLESFFSRHHYTAITDSDLDELIRGLRQGFPNSGISMILGHLRSRNIFVQRQRVRESLVRTDPAGSAMRWFNTITKACLQCPRT